MCVVVNCKNCARTTCPDSPPPRAVGICVACGDVVYDTEECYLIDGEIVHYDCLHEYHKDDRVME